MSRVQDAQDLRAETTKLREELALQAKAFSNHETSMYQELANLRQFEKLAKRLLFEKFQEALQLESKILPLRNKVIDLKEKVEGMPTQMAKLEERATQREVQLG